MNEPIETRTNASLLVISRGHHPGVDGALARLVSDGSLRTWQHEGIDHGQDAHTAEATWKRLAATITRNHTELVVFHHYHSPALPDPRPFIESLRATPHRPLIAFTGGDPFHGVSRPAHPQVFKRASEAADITLNTSAGVAADAITGYGAKLFALWPNSACTVRFSKPKEPYRASETEFDVVFVGSNNKSRNPTNSFFWFSRQRERLVKTLDRKFGARLAVFGNGWEGLRSAQGPTPFDAQIETCRRARVVVGGVPYSPARYYTSNRPFIQIMSGVPFVDIAVDGVETILRDGEHWHLVDSIDRVADRCDDLLARNNSELEELGELAASYVAAHHMSTDRWRSLLRTLLGVRQSLLAGELPPQPDLSFFLPEVTIADELPLATRGWVS